MSYSSKYLGEIIDVKIDRILGSKHPEYDFYYPVNYGFIENTKAPDGEEIDAYILGVYKPIEKFTGRVVAIIHRTNDDDDKLVVVPENINYTEGQIRALTEFQERFFESIIIRK